jgi:MtN3 and saliva related transmembrane protein
MYHPGQICVGADVTHQVDLRRLRDQPLFSARQSRFTTFVDRGAVIVGIIAPLSTIPQIVQIYTSQSAEDLSLGTWGLFIAFGLFWLLYGAVHRSLPLVLTNALWLLCYGAVVFGAVLYR